MPFQFTVRSDKDTHFTGTIAQNANENENIVVPGCLAGIRGNVRSYLRSITILSDQNLAWEIMMFSADSFDDADADVDTMIGWWQFSTAGAVQIAAAGLFRYYIDGLAVPVLDDDNTSEIHIMLLNRSATGKNSGATGEIVVELVLEPMVAQGPTG